MRKTLILTASILLSACNDDTKNIVYEGDPLQDKISTLISSETTILSLSYHNFMVSEPYWGCSLENEKGESGIEYSSDHKSAHDCLDKLIHLIEYQEAPRDD